MTAPRRPVRRLAVAAVLTALIGVWVSHTVEYARTGGLAGPGPGVAASVHLYMLPTAGVLGLLAALGATRLWRSWVALSWRLAHTRAGIEAAWRGRRPSHPVPRAGPLPSLGCRLVALWLPLTVAQIGLYLLQENLEARWSGRPAPGLDPVTGVHWAAPLVHLAVALVLASGAAALIALFRRRAHVVRCSERLLSALIRALVAHVVPPGAARRRMPSPVDIFGTCFLPRPPPATPLD